MTDGNLADRTIVITGGNSGIGLEAAVALAARAARVVVTSRNAQRGRDALERIRRRSGSEAVDVMPLDLSDFMSIRSFAAELLERHDRLDVLVNNAGAALSDAACHRRRLRGDVRREPPRALPAHVALAGPTRRVCPRPDRQRVVDRPIEVAVCDGTTSTGRPVAIGARRPTTTRSSAMSCSRPSLPAVSKAQASRRTAATRVRSERTSGVRRTCMAPSGW